MSARDLVEKWEEALEKAVRRALRETEKPALADEELLQAGLPLASRLRAGQPYPPGPTMDDRNPHCGLVCLTTNRPTFQPGCFPSHPW
jgi:hypothetical protein